MSTSDFNHQDRIISLQGGINFRDLGGYQGMDGRRIKWRHLFRSGSTHALGDIGQRHLFGLGIRAAIDLRSNQERLEHPHILSERHGVLYRSFDHDRAGGHLLEMLRQPQLEAAHLEQAMVELYRGLPYEFSDLYQQLFQSIAAGSLPLVFNCAAGKDRTGVAAALLLNALGVNWEDIVDDYLISRQFVPDITRMFQGSKAGLKLQQVEPSIVAPIFSVDRAYIEGMREAIIERSGTFEDYYHSELRLKAATLEQLRLRLLA